MFLVVNIAGGTTGVDRCVWPDHIDGEESSEAVSRAQHLCDT